MGLTLYGVDLWAGALLFARVGALIMLLPGVGEQAVPARVRLAFAVLLTAILAPSLANTIPDPPADVWAMGGMLITEIVIGLILGGAARLLMTALATAGQIMGLETGLAFAQTADPTQTQSGQIFAVFLGLFGVALIFATELHHVFLAGIVGSYGVFSPGVAPDAGDAAQLAIRSVSTSFLVGLQIAAPVIVGGLIFRVGLGALARLIPTIQVFFVALPLQLLGGFCLIALGVSAGMLVWLQSLREFASPLGGL
ncbi:MAG: flagellar type III secretion system protein FliR [Alphaproteobacteria bacterium]|nr:flagellar type III secretion system protein FliR [Alphaproteobacteria bacterium]